MADIVVEVVYALPHHSCTQQLILPAGADVGEALRRAAAMPPFAGLDLATASVAVFGRRARPNQALKTGDRVEILRELPHDPKEARRRRVSKSGGS